MITIYTRNRSEFYKLLYYIQQFPNFFTSVSNIDWGKEMKKRLQSNKYKMEMYLLEDNTFQGWNYITKRNPRKHNGVNITEVCKIKKIKYKIWK